MNRDKWEKFTKIFHLNKITQIVGIDEASLKLSREKSNKSYSLCQPVKDPHAWSYNSLLGFMLSSFYASTHPSPFISLEMHMGWLALNCLLLCYKTIIACPALQPRDTAHFLPKSANLKNIAQCIRLIDPSQRGLNPCLEVFDEKNKLWDFVWPFPLASKRS